MKFDVEKMKQFVFELNALDGLNCPENQKEFDKYNQGFQDAKSTIQVYLDKNFPKPIIHEQSGIRQ